MKEILYLITNFLFLSLICPKSQPLRPSKDHALFFAVKDYDNWTDLKNPIRDADGIAIELKEKYEFDDIKIIQDPTFEVILSTLNQYITKKYGPDDQLFIFFSGHGAFNDLTNEGFFIPKEAIKDDPYQKTYFPLTRLERSVNSIPCPHILLTIDACYSGTINEEIALEKGDSIHPTWRRPGVNNESTEAKNNWIKTRLEKRSRFCITSGGKERTSDGIEHSPMASALINRLSNPGEDNVITMEELIAALRNLQPSPKAFTFGSHQLDGNFLFIKKEIFASFDLQGYEQKQQDFQAWKTAQKGNSPATYLKYIQDFPNGSFKEEARKAINIAEEELEWDYAKEKKTAENYQIYLKHYPKGIHAVEARSNLSFFANKDTDNDGIMDSVDECPTEFGLVNFKGCPGLNDASFIDPFIGQMIFLKGGSYTMGDANGEIDEKPAHVVSVKNFYIGATEITQEQWRLIMINDPEGLANKGCDKCPVEKVSWEDAQEFIKRLNARTGKKYRLPLETEWEYAARGGEKSHDFVFSGSNNADEVAWYTDNVDGKSKPVKLKKPNELGIYDMSGNVWEWCQDTYDFYQADKTHIIGWDNGIQKVYRGGTFYLTKYRSRVASRRGGAISLRNESIGFRVAL